MDKAWASEPLLLTFKAMERRQGSVGGSPTNPSSTASTAPPGNPQLVRRWFPINSESAKEGDLLV